MRLMFTTVCLVVVVVLAVPLGAAARSASGGPVALVTAETENELIAIDPVSGRVLRRVSLPADPERLSEIS